MSTNSVYCHILGSTVSVVSDLNGNVTNVICPEFNRLTHDCLIKHRGLGYIGTVVARFIDTGKAKTKAVVCEFAEARDILK